MPNDEEEQDRLALMHHAFKLLLGGDLFRAPIHQPRRILDVGTGTGIWALEMAEEFPNAEIMGTDLSPIQPNWAPPNCTFLVDDAESDWAYTKEESFDYIHARSMGGSIADWGRLLRQAYDHVKPGGWVEIQESETWVRSDDGTCKDAVMVRALQQKLEEGSTKFGKRMNIAPEVRGYMQRAGFENVTDDIYKVSLSTCWDMVLESDLPIKTVSCRHVAEIPAFERDRSGGKSDPLRLYRAICARHLHSCPGLYI